MSRTDAIQRLNQQRRNGHRNYGYTYLNMEFLRTFPGGEIRRWRADQGTNYLKILPPRNPDAYFGFPINIHRNIGTDNDSFLCPHFMQKTSCPVCEYTNELRQTADSDDEDMRNYLRSLSPLPPRWLYFVVDMKNQETTDMGPQLYEGPQTINDEILGLSEDQRTGETLDISDPRAELEFRFDRVGQRLQTRYSRFQIAENSTWRNEWLEIPDFDDVIAMHPYETIAEVFQPGSPPGGGGGSPAVSREPAGVPGRSDQRGASRRNEADERDDRNRRREEPAQQERGTEDGDSRDRSFREERPPSRGERADVGRDTEPAEAAPDDQEDSNADRPGKYDAIRDRVRGRLGDNKPS